jgi:hypothetical protein
VSNSSYACRRGGKKGASAWTGGVWGRRDVIRPLMDPAWTTLSITIVWHKVFLWDQ